MVTGCDVTVRHVITLTGSLTNAHVTSQVNNSLSLTLSLAGSRELILTITFFDNLIDVPTERGQKAIALLFWFQNYYVLIDVLIDLLNSVLINDLIDVII